MSPNLKKKNKSRDVYILIFLIVLTLNSGCLYGPKKPLVITNHYLYSGNTEQEIIDFLINYNLENFISKTGYAFEGFEYDINYYVRNISEFIENAINHYNDSSSLIEGEVSLAIDCFATNSTNIPDILSDITSRNQQLQLENSSIDYFVNVLGCQFGAFQLENSSTKIVGGEKYLEFTDSIFSLADLSNVTWIIPLTLVYKWAGRGEACRSYEFYEIMLVSDKLDVKGLFTTVGGFIC